jgi:hypothetical protein
VAGSSLPCKLDDLHQLLSNYSYNAGSVRWCKNDRSLFIIEIGDFARSSIGRSVKPLFALPACSKGNVPLKGQLRLFPRIVVSDLAFVIFMQFLCN